MTNNQQTPEEAQEDIIARLALISKAVEEKLSSKLQGASSQEAAGPEPDMLVVSPCPIDPMERLLCESCQ